MTPSIGFSVLRQLNGFTMKSLVRLTVRYYSGAFKFRLKRMGSFTSAPKIPNEDTVDEDVFFPPTSTWFDIRARCQVELAGLPPSLHRTFAGSGELKEENVRVMQWNILSQALAEGSDRFVSCPMDALSWQFRRWRILAEIAAVQPHVLCLQEVDHFRFLQKALSSVGLYGTFCPKPDSPCLYIPSNNGPDGCSLFVDTSRYDVVDTKTRCLEVWGCQTNQVAILCKLRRKLDSSEFWVGTTHLKARTGPFLAALRKEQGYDLMDFIQRSAGENVPLLLTGDFNAGPTEPIHSVLSSKGLASAYRGAEPSFTTYTIRDDGEHCETLDYVLYSKHAFSVRNYQRLPTEYELGPCRVPSYTYPSDHFSLVADFEIYKS